MAAAGGKPRTEAATAGDPRVPGHRSGEEFPSSRLLPETSRYPPLGGQGPGAQSCMCTWKGPDGTGRHGTGRDGTKWNGMKWNGMERYGTALAWTGLSTVPGRLQSARPSRALLLSGGTPSSSIGTMESRHRTHERGKGAGVLDVRCTMDDGRWTMDDGRCAM
ncbi:hypothetical protein B2J93_2724 [Marssonina coronariae]|uniref:Uncharacterized protein n=1 Tax=Diplocarpon coronariae TaxID=2795749 RepID=A0A218Z5L7_9HELO|nr:hypothetical protein B2J93_2724 [Marssonina coronariae]